MQRKTLIVSISSLGAAALVAVAVFATGSGGASAYGRWAGGHGWGGPPGGHAARICSDRRDARIDDGIRFVEAFVTFTPEQTGPWNALTTAVRSGSARIGQACETATAEGSPSQAPQRLARAELALTTALGVVQEVRPAFADLYGKLNDEQRARIDELLSHRGRFGR